MRSGGWSGVWTTIEPAGVEGSSPEPTRGFDSAGGGLLSREVERTAWSQGPGQNGGCRDRRHGHGRHGRGGARAQAECGAGSICFGVELYGAELYLREFVRSILPGSSSL